MQERRATVRINRLSRGQYCPSEDLIPRDGRMTNLSDRGAGLLTQEHRRVNERVTVSFSLPDEEEPLTATGVVRWADTEARQGRWYPLGVEWLPLEETARHRLHTFLGNYTQRLSRRDTVAGGGARPLRTFLLWSGAIVGVLVIAALSRWGIALQQENRQLGGTIQQRNAVINQLEQRGARLEEELTASQAKLIAAAEAMSHLGSQTQDLEGDVQRLTQEVERFQQSYVQIREERNQLVEQRTQLTEERGRLIQQVLDLEQERSLLSRRLDSIPELRLAIHEAIETRRALERRARFQARQQAKAQDAVDGNRGYLIWQGQPTLGRAGGWIKVHDLEASPSNP